MESEERVRMGNVFPGDDKTAAARCFYKPVHDRSDLGSP